MAFSIRNLKIRQQILLVTLPPMFVLLCAIALLFYAYWMSRQTDRAVRQSAESVIQGEQVLRHLTEMHGGVRGYLLTRDRRLLAAYENVEPEIPQEFAALRELEGDDPAAVAAVDAILAETHQWQAQWVLPTIEKVKQGDTSQWVSILADGEKRIASLRERLTTLLQADRAEYAGYMRESEQAMRRMLLLALGVALMVAVVVLLLTREVAGLLEQPVLQLIEASQRVRRGDFQPSLPPSADNEFGVLSQSFSDMTTALRQDRQELAALNKFSEAVTQCTSESEIYEHVLHLLRERFKPRQAIIFRLNTAENYLEAAASLLPLPEEVRDWPIIEEPHNCKAVRMGRRFLVNDVTAEPLCPAKFIHPKEGSYYCGPLIAGGIIIGAVRLEGPADFWTPERETLLESYLSGTASALSNLRLLETMKQRANIDELTGLYNRRFLEDYGRKLIAMARRKESPFGVIMMDLDHFKEFNDVYGHEVGDRILRHFAKTVTPAIRETNLAARFGGEEFVVLLPDTGLQPCLLVAERIRNAVARSSVPLGPDRPASQLTVSLGIAVYPDHGQTLEELLLASDKALYESKRAGRNRTTVYVPMEEAAG
jgi:diguanylate cyclase (GGDEF)-like protein